MDAGEPGELGLRVLHKVLEVRVHLRRSIGLGFRVFHLQVPAEVSSRVAQPFCKSLGADLYGLRV